MNYTRKATVFGKEEGEKDQSAEQNLKIKEKT